MSESASLAAASAPVPDLVDQAQRKLVDEQFYEEIRIAVAEVGFKEVLFLLGTTDRTTLSNQIECRENKRPSARLVLVLCQAQKSRRLLNFLNATSGCVAPLERESMSPEEELVRLKTTLAQSGVAGAAILEKALGPAIRMGR